MDGPSPSLTEVYRGHRYVLAIEAAGAAGELVDRLRELGADDVMVVAPTMGVGELAEDVHLELVDVAAGPTPTEGIRNTAAAFLAPPDPLVRALDAFDARRVARVLTSPYMPSPTLLGRRVYGGRPPEWERLEDKLSVLQLWDAADVASAPTRVVDLADAPAAASEVASELGSVWAADNSTGWHGGGSHTRWVPDQSAAAGAVEFFAGLARRVRVMPFMDGTPCSVHGIVTDRGVAVGRPVELLMLRTVEPRGFFYAQVATTWDPSDARREEMRAVALRVGEVLDRWVGYRGAFGIDGVSTAGGFLPNELNTRLSAGLYVYAGSAPGLELGLLNRCLIERDVDVDPEWVEEVVVRHGDERRVAGCGIPLADVIGPERVSIRLTASGLEEVDDGARDGVVDIGPSINGSYLRFKLEDHAFEPGASMAPIAVAVARFAAERWNVDVPELEPAPDVR